MIDFNRDTHMYYLKNKNKYSPNSTFVIRRKFEEYKTDMGWQLGYNRTLSGCYENDNLQTAWENYFNGFRQAEDI